MPATYTERSVTGHPSVFIAHLCWDSRGAFLVETMLLGTHIVVDDDLTLMTTEQQHVFQIQLETTKNPVDKRTAVF